MKILFLECGCLNIRKIKAFRKNWNYKKGKKCKSKNIIKSNRKNIKNELLKK